MVSIVSYATLHSVPSYVSVLLFVLVHIVIISVNAVKVTANRLGGQCDASVLS